MNATQWAEFAGLGFAMAVIPQWWSWLLTAVGVTGLYFAGQKRPWAWLIGLGAQLLWIAYAIATAQWGFIASAVAYGSVYANNHRLWWRDRETA